MQVIVDGLAISYFKTGEGPKSILLLHGWADSAQTFDGLCKQLADDYKFVAVDLPGFGGSQIPERIWTLKDYSNFVGAFAAKLELEIEAVIGHSNGGAIAVYGLSHKKIKAKKLVLLASSGIRHSNKLRKQLLKALAKPAKLLIKAAPQSTQRRIKQKLYGAIGSDYMVAEHMRKTFKNIVSTDVLEEARKLDIPTLLIYGDEDQHTPLAQGRLLESAISDAKLIVMKKTGHFVHQEQVSKVARLIKDYVK